MYIGHYSVEHDVQDRWSSFLSMKFTKLVRVERKEKGISEVEREREIGGAPADQRPLGTPEVGTAAS